MFVSLSLDAGVREIKENAGSVGTGVRLFPRKTGRSGVTKECRGFYIKIYLCIDKKTTVTGNLVPNIHQSYAKERVHMHMHARVRTCVMRADIHAQVMYAYTRLFESCITERPDKRLRKKREEKKIK